MYHSLLRIKNFCWLGHRFQPGTDIPIPAPGGMSAPLRGRFACAAVRSNGRVTLTRDALGLNKLFVAIHDSGRVVAANYLIDLVRHGVPFEAIYSVPAGYAADVDPARGSVVLSRYADVDRNRELAPAAVEDVARDIRAELELWFSRLAAQFGERQICVCLSGGIDSGIIAALAKRHFRDVIAYTYTFVAPGMTRSEDARYAEELAKVLRIPLRLVPASEDEVLAALDNALCYGQDWRDFNVHCAIVNDIVARAIRRDTDSSGSRTMPLVLTGDLANEFLADYTPVAYGDQEYYRLPRLRAGALQQVLIQGLDAGDREVGIFSHHGLDVLQPYGFIVDQYLRLPDSFIGGTASKQSLAKQMAGDLLPAFVLDRPKVRAQVGDSTLHVGILPLLIRRGYGAEWLRHAFCRLFQIEHAAFLDRFVRGGRYRFVQRFSDARVTINGYVAG
jgi:asparagine synthetase B (glutamine-hydrolysing)